MYNYIECILNKLRKENSIILLYYRSCVSKAKKHKLIQESLIIANKSFHAHIFRVKVLLCFTQIM